MSWARIDDRLFGHPKVLAAGMEAMGLWVQCLAYSVAQLTDGFVPSAVVHGLVSRRSRLPDALVKAGLWERDETLNGWWIHDYRDFNPSRTEVLQERENKRKAGVEGARKRWSKGSETDGRTDGSCHAPAIGSSDAPVPIPSRPDLEKEISPPSHLPSVGAPPSGGPAQPTSKKAPKASTARGTRLPEDWAPSLQVIAWAKAKGVDHRPAAEAFIDHWLASAGPKANKVNWNAAFRGWLRRDIEMGRAVGLPPPEYQPPPVGDLGQVSTINGAIAALTKARVVPPEKKGTSNGSR